MIFRRMTQCLFVLLCTILAACGGGGDESEKVLSDSSRRALQIEFIEREPGDITAANVENLVVTVARNLQWLIKQFKPSNEGWEAPLFNPALDANDNGIHVCERGGRLRSNVRAPAKLESAGERVLGVGDQFELIAELCAEVFANKLTTVINGARTFIVEKGAHSFDKGQAISFPTTLFANYEHLYLAGDGVLVYQYEHGALRKYYEAESTRVTGNEFRVIDTAYGWPIRSIFRELDVRVGRYAVTTWHDGDNLTLNTPLTLESEDMAMRVDVAGVSELRVDGLVGNDIGEGSVRITSEKGSVTVVFQESYLDYALDINGDDIADVTGLIYDTSW